MLLLKLTRNDDMLKTIIVTHQVWYQQLISSIHILKVLDGKITDFDQMVEWLSHLYHICHSKCQRSLQCENKTRNFFENVKILNYAYQNEKKS